MLATKDIHKEANFLREMSEDENLTDVPQLLRGVIRGLMLQIKLMQNIRTNQSRLMEAQGVKKIIPRDRNQTGQVDKSPDDKDKTETKE